MTPFLHPTPALYDPFPPPSGTLGMDAPNGGGQEDHQIVREAVQEARRRWRDWAEPQAGQILRDALARYRRPDGYEGYLVEAAWQIEQMGQEAWPVLRELVLAGAQEVEYFLGAVVRLEGVAPQGRLTTLLDAARNPDANVRSRLLELLEEMPGGLRREVLRELTAKGRPDDGVTDRAREAWDEQVS